MNERKINSKGRIARYAAITCGVTLAAYLLQTVESTLLARQGVEVLASVSVYSALAVNVLTAIVIAVLNRRYAFRSELSWVIVVPVLVLLEMIYDALMTSVLWRPMILSLMEQPWSASQGTRLSAARAGSNLVQFVLWAVLAYLFQRFVLYRESLDTNGLAVRAHGYKGEDDQYEQERTAGD